MKVPEGRMLVLIYLCSLRILKWSLTLVTPQGKKYALEEL